MHILYIFTAGHFYSANNKKWFPLLKNTKGQKFTILIVECDEQIKTKFTLEYGSFFNIIYFKNRKDLLSLSLLDRYQYVRALAVTLDNLDPDIIHLHAAFNSYMVYPLFFIKKKPKIIYNIWGSDFNLGYYNNFKRRQIIKWLIRKTSLVWTNWFAMRDKVIKEFPKFADKIQTILWGTDGYLFKPEDTIAQENIQKLYDIKKNDYVMLYVRGFTLNSNHKLLIESLKYVNKDFAFKLILHYPHFEHSFVMQLKKQISTLGLMDKIILSHNLLNDKEMKTLFEISDLTFSLTTQEQFSRSIFEAILSDTNLILNEIPPYQYLKNHFKFNIIMVDVNDTKKLGNQINDFINKQPTPDWTYEKTIIRKYFDFETKSEQYIQIYKKLLNNHPINISYPINGKEDAGTI